MVMSQAEFDEFIKRHKGRASEDIDWVARKSEWLKGLDRLFAEIQELLKGYIARGDITFRYDSVEINEERLGTYTARRLVLRIGDQEVALNPVGTVIFGARGRVDLVGSTGEVRLVLVPKAASRTRLSISTPNPRKIAPAVEPAGEWRWKLASQPPSTDLSEITAESLMNAIMEVAGG
jgi:hypothetical protein